MRRFSKTPQRTKWLDLWPEWDIVLELDHRDGDPNPAFAISYMKVEVDWGDGNDPVTYTHSSATQTQTYSGTYPIGKHIVKLRVTQRYNNSGILYFGNGTNTSLNGDPLMPQLVRVKKFDASGDVSGRPKIQSLNCCFNRCLRLESIDCPFIVGNATDMNSSFRFCVKLRDKIEIPYLAAVTSMTNCFYNCIGLEEAKLGDAPLLTTFSYIFYNCPSLRKVSLGAFSKNLNCGYAFWGCKKLADITWKGHINFSTLAYCFYGCNSLEELPEIGDQPYCASLSYTFTQCSSLKHIVLGDFSVCTSLSHTFEHDFDLEEVYLTGLTKVGDAQAVCYYCKSLSSVTLGGLGPSCTAFANAFYECSALTGSFTLPDMPECTSFGGAFYNTGLSSIVISNAPKVTSIQEICARMKKLKSFKAGQMPLVTTVARSFNLCEELEEIELHIPNGTIINAQDFCNSCYKLKKMKGEARLRPQGPSLTATYWNNLFAFCRSLEELPDVFPTGGWASSFSVANVAHTAWFSNCVSLTGTVPNWIWETWPGKATTQESTFLNCFKLDNYNNIPNYWKGGNIII